ncbi:MAG: transposase [Christensenellales bacterium]
MEQSTVQRNGQSAERELPKTVRSTMGEIELDIPRDRQGIYEPQLISKGTKDVGGPVQNFL